MSVPQIARIANAAPTGGDRSRLDATLATFLNAVHRTLEPYDLDVGLDRWRDRANARDVVRDELARRANDPTTLDLVIDLLVALAPEDARIVATDIVSTLDWPDPATNRHPALGRLTRELFDDAALHLSFSPDNYSRTTYLRDQLAQNTNLAGGQRDLATTLAAGWEGTLDALLETTRTLYPSPA